MQDISRNGTIYRVKHGNFQYDILFGKKVVDNVYYVVLDDLIVAISKHEDTYVVKRYIELCGDWGNHCSAQLYPGGKQ
jgi:hypothetical protein